MGRRDTAKKPAPSTWGRHAHTWAAGARRPRGPGRAPGRDAAARSPRRRRLLTSPGRARARPAQP